jgi:hypothetical protein
VIDHKINLGALQDVKFFSSVMFCCICVPMNCLVFIEDGSRMMKLQSVFDAACGLVLSVESIIAVNVAAYSVHNAAIIR